MVSEETKLKRLKEEECTINRLPHDCIERIFVGLPVSTLLKCSGVCKQWYKLIRDPHFIAGHLERAPRCALLFFPQESVSGKRYPSDVIIFDELQKNTKLYTSLMSIKTTLKEPSMSFKFTRLVVKNGETWKHAVISFDLSEETFTRIQLPTAALGSSNSRRYWISEIDGKVGIMHGMKQREGWELKKWQPWKREIHEIEDTWRNVYELEQNSLAFPRHLGMVTKEVLQHLSDEVIQQRVTAEVDQILQHLPDCPVQHPRSSRRVNWVERKWDKEKLSARIDGAKDMAKASKQAHSDILRALSNVRDHLQGASSSAANAPAE
ncbi:hypothetical protein QOZ80_6AG0538880 [Eleusine coracana subsp. coracana]|nr:hypothetical protein QOZ80_6AG0538880 [Eleusine coracana subsp. coracana]